MVSVLVSRSYVTRLFEVGTHLKNVFTLKFTNLVWGVQCLKPRECWDAAWWGGSPNVVSLGAEKAKINATIFTLFHTTPPFPSLLPFTIIYSVPFLFWAGWAWNLRDRCEIYGKTTDRCDITRRRKWVNFPGFQHSLMYLNLGSTETHSESPH